MVNIFVADNNELAQKYANNILLSNINLLGFDTETTQPSDGVSTIQLSDEANCYIFQIRRIGYSSLLNKILISSTIIKVGVNADLDVRKIEKELGIRCLGVIDIQYIAITLGISCSSLDDLVSLYDSEYNKKDKISYIIDWDNKLTEIGMVYAANDAYYSLLIYFNMVKGTKIIRSDIIDDDDNMFVSWIKDNIKSDRKFSSVVNQIVNSYGPWRNKYTTVERKQKAEKKLLKILPSLSGINFDKDRMIINQIQNLNQ